METVNMADCLGGLFLIIGIWDGFRKGFVKKGTSLVITLVTLFVVYLAAPFVESFFHGVLPSAIALENLVGSDSEIYRMLLLSGFEEQAEAYVQLFAARALSLSVTYIVVRIFLRTFFLPLEMLAKVPGLSFLNRLMGAGFGLAQQLLLLWLFLLLVAIFSSTSWGAYLYQTVQESVWMSVLYENNLLFLIGILLILKI